MLMVSSATGDVFFVTKDQVTSAPAGQSLAFANSNGNAILRVDNFSTVAYPEKRNTVCLFLYIFSAFIKLPVG